MFWDMLRIRWNDLTGKYDGAPPGAAESAKTLPGKPGKQV
jgi:hypothetical protein